MRLKFHLDPLEDGIDGEEVIAGLAVARQWELDHGRPVAAALDEGYVGPLLELAALAYNRKHGKNLTVDEFADRYDLGRIESAGGGAAVPPSDPATAPPSA